MFLFVCWSLAVLGFGVYLGFRYREQIDEFVANVEKAWDHNQEVK